MKNKTGVYIGVLVTNESKRKLLEFCEKMGISLTDSDNNFEKRMHSTIMYSKKGRIDEVSVNEIKIKAKPQKWEVFKSAMTGNRCLVLKLNSEKMEEIHNQIRNTHHLSHAFDDYQPHISLHYDYKGEIPIDLPDFDIDLQDVYVKKLIHQVNSDNKQELKNITSSINLNDNKNDLISMNDVSYIEKENKKNNFK